MKKTNALWIILDLIFLIIFNLLFLYWMVLIRAQRHGYPTGLSTSLILCCW